MFFRIKKFICLIFLSVNIFIIYSQENKNWSLSEKNDFLETCNNQFDSSFSVSKESYSKFCDCFLNKSMNDFNSLKIADSIANSWNNSEVQKYISDCTFTLNQSFDENIIKNLNEDKKQPELTNPKTSSTPINIENITKNIKSYYPINDLKLSYQEKKKSGNYFPFIKFEENDSISLPINLQVGIDITELREVDIINDYFYIELDLAYLTDYFGSYIDYNDENMGVAEEIDLNPSFYSELQYPESDQLYKSELTYEGRITTERKETKTWYGYRENFRGIMPHKWNLRDYPFDSQELKIKFQTYQDTSFVRVDVFPEYNPNINPENISYLLDGYKVADFSTDNTFINGNYEINYADSYRAEVTQILTFNIILDREGSYIYFKLFFGGFLSYLVSILVFFIDKKLFETRITLSLGGIFGAVGNKYFVENTMPSIQVLTKADLINNLIILFIILNIFFVIAQSSKKINVGVFEDNKKSLIIMASVFILLNFLIVLI